MFFPKPIPGSRIMSSEGWPFAIRRRAVESKLSLTSLTTSL